jgi:cell division transport system ATP-binding protein
MSRTPVKVLNKTQASEPRETAVVRVLRAAVASAGSGSLSFDVPGGGAHILLGGPGAGKTAVLEMIAMARPPGRGGVELFGKDLARLRPDDRPALRRRIGMVFQTPRLAAELSARDNLALAVRAAGRDDKPFDNDIRDLLAWVGLGRRGHFRPGELDTEGRRRLALARALINRPELVIVDEPAGEGGMAILRLLAELNAAGTPLLMATRDAALAEGCGAEVTRIGAPAATAPTAELES